jgi:BirA family biotin operon repressor/biotin-[acetyl-CoA-carboxylase] ligase
MRQYPDIEYLVSLDVVGSTNDHAKMLAREGALEGTVVCARRQTAGRGRQGNRWESADGNLFMTMVLRPKTPPARTGQLSFVAAVALAETLEECLPRARVALKWPNDALIDGKKAAGILLEAEAAGADIVEWVVIGIGVNIVDAPDFATSLAANGAADVTAADVMKAVCARIEGLYRLWREKGFAPIRDAWTARAAFLGETINVRLPQESFAARLAGIDENGALQAELPDGTLRVVASGEVFAV